MGDNVILFDKHLVAFRRLEEDMELESLTFEHAVFWVQIENLPFLSQKREVAESLSATIGEVLRTTSSDAEMGGGRGMRIRVRINITQPLSRGQNRSDQRA